MPNYDYNCADCGHSFEELQGINDPALTDCPQCKKKSLKRLIGGGLGVIFKGSGYYINDSKGSKKSSGKETA